MDYWINVVIFAVVCGAMDRWRGMDTFVPAAVTKLLFGFIVAAFIVQETTWPVAVGMILFAIGSAPGWGIPIGAALSKVPMAPPFESWQKGALLRSNTYVALAARGAMWGGAVIPLVFVPPFNLMWLAPVVAMPIAMIVSILIANRVEPVVRERWAKMEMIRGFLFGLIVGGLGYVIF